jgi:hypothetical protein
MAEKTSKTTPQDELGASEEFILPVAPPPQPSNSARKEDQFNEPTTPPSSAGNGNGDSGFESNGTPLVGIAPSSASDAAGDDAPIDDQLVVDDTLLPREDIDESTVPHLGGAKSEGATAPMAFVVVLIIMIIGLLFYIANKHSNQTVSDSAVIQTTSDANKELISAREEADAMRQKVAELTTKLRGMESHAGAEQSAAASKIADMLRQKRETDKKVFELQAEVERLNRLVRSPAASEMKHNSAATVQPLPQAEGALYRVSGLRPGDTLNVRGGPGVQNPIVTQLQNGVRVRVIGPSVSNGPDVWLPCLVNGSVTDPATGVSRPWQQKGWINSMFVEEILSP